MKKLIIGIILLLVTFSAFAADPVISVTFGHADQIAQVAPVADQTFLEGVAAFFMLTALPFVILLSPWLAILFIFSSFYFLDAKYYSKSTFTMTLSFICVGLYFWNEIAEMFTSIGLIATIAYFAAGYIFAGIITAFIFWVFYNWKAKERFENLLDEQDLPNWAKSISFAGSHFLETPVDEYVNSLRKYLVVINGSNRKEIFDDVHGELNFNVTDLKVFPSARDRNNTGESDAEFINGIQISKSPTKQQLDDAVAQILPPRFKTCKSFVIGASFSWPITLLWLLLNRVVKQLIERVVSLFGGTFDKISALTFGKF
jgi:hypothetical protein